MGVNWDSNGWVGRLAAVAASIGPFAPRAARRTVARLS